MKEINIKNYYIVNPAYKFRNDIKRVVVTNNNSLYVNIYDRMVDSYDIGFSTIMSPLVAQLFSSFNGEKNLENIILNLSSLLKISKDEVLHVFSQFINNSEQMVYPLSTKIYAPIPKNFIIEKQNLPTRDLLESIDVENMLLDEDLTTLRYYIPNELTLMITNKCYTDCIYCYANTSHKVNNPLNFERIEKLIKEAHSLGCRDFGIGGGDFFRYKQWPELLDVLHKYEYNPYISTKFPIGENEAIKLKEHNVSKIQISIDTVNGEQIKTLLNVPSTYLDKLKKSFDVLRKHGISFIVKAVVTKYNDDLESIKNLIDFLLQYENLYSLSIAPGESSLYKPFVYNSNKENLSRIESYVKNLNHPKVSMQSYMISIDNLSFEEKMEKHNKRSTCSGNVTSCYILPDGKVTICEQTYWHPFFILGDLTQQSILEMWGSSKALSLWNITQDSIQESSPCKKCETFEKCRRGQGSCWRMAIQAFGKDKYDYPYPQCPYAPPATEPFYIDKTATL
jgi:radical SAM protein with 4Fe4S-binding SPASM domain